MKIATESTGIDPALSAAMQEACDLIVRDRRRAAQIYNDVAKVKQPLEETLRILEDPNSKFSAVPEGTMRYAEFMSRVGAIKAKPASWSDYFFATIPSGS